MWSLISLMTCSTSHGFTHRITSEAPLTASGSEEVVYAPDRASGSSLPGEGLATLRSAGASRKPGTVAMSPRAMALPIAPAPMIAAFILL